MLDKCVFDIKQICLFGLDKGSMGVRVVGGLGREAREERAMGRIRSGRCIEDSNDI